MKELLLRMAHYNVWANGLFIEMLRNLPDETLDMEIVSSFSSVRKTVLHVWSAEDIWLQRLLRVSQPVWQAAIFGGDMALLCDQWESSSTALVSYLEELSGLSSLEEVIPIVNMKGEHYNDAVSSILLHVFNHATYHRGQLVTMLRQAGITTIPGTDLVAFTRA